MTDVIWSCILVATEVMKNIETLEEKHIARVPQVDMTELRFTLKATKEALMAYLSQLKTNTSSTLCDPSFECLIDSIRVQSLEEIKKMLQTADSILASSSGSPSSSSSSSSSGWINRKIALYKLDFILKLKLDQLLALFPLSGALVQASSPSNSGRRNHTPSSSSTSSPGSSSSSGVMSRLIDDPDARSFWTSTFGDKTTLVPYRTFVSALEQKIGAKLHVTRLDKEEEGEEQDADVEMRMEMLKEYLDFTQDGFVTPFEFNVFLRWFGPLGPGCVERLTKPLSDGLLSGFTPAIEADQLLKGKEPGTYLIRFSKTTLGSYAVTFTDSKGGVKHCLLFSVQPAGVTLRNPPEVYTSLTNFARTHTNKLKTPVGNSWSTKKRRNQVESPSNSKNNTNTTKGGTSTTAGAVESFLPQPKELLCTVCMDEKIQTVFLECGHLACCKNCSSKLSNCPICRQRISRIVNIFIPVGN